MKILVMTFLVFSAHIAGQTKLKLIFMASDSTTVSEKNEYDSIWYSESKKIVEAMERISGMNFIDTLVIAHVVDMPSNSGGLGTPMRLRSSYPTLIKQGTLIHELGHRLHFCLKRRTKDFNDHELLFLYLYDVWLDLYGEEFAQLQIKAENKRSNKTNNYKEMWEKALKLGADGRKIKLKQMVESQK